VYGSLYGTLGRIFLNPPNSPFPFRQTGEEQLGEPTRPALRRLSEL
jgi:hypothetical protein